MDAEQFKHIILPHQPAMQRMALAILGSEPLAQDTVQDSVVQLWQQRASLHSVTNVEAYCIAIVKRKSIDILRRSHPRQPINEEALMQVEPPPDDTDERYQQALALLAQLPQQQSQAILLKYEHQLSANEIARRLGTSPNNVGVMLFRGLEKLRKLIANQ